MFNINRLYGRLASYRDRLITFTAWVTCNNVIGLSGPGGLINSHFWLANDGAILRRQATGSLIMMAWIA